MAHRFWSRYRVGASAGGVLLSCAFLASVAIAQEPGATAEERMRRGIELRWQGRDSDALEEFRAAFALEPSARGRAQIGLAEQALGRWVDAETDLSEALRDRADRWIAENAETLQGALDAVQSHIGTLTVNSNWESAELWVNGVRVGGLPRPALHLPEGIAQLELHAVGHEPIAWTVSISGRATVSHSIVRVSERPVFQSLGPGPARAHSPALAWGMLGAASVSVLGALSAEWVSRHEAALYNDDKLCFYGDLSRDQRCGVHRGRADLARTLATLGYVAVGALGVSAATLFLIVSRERPPGGLSVAVERHGLQVGCSATF